MSSLADREYTYIGDDVTGKPILRETGEAQLGLYPLRFVVVHASSITAAREIQTHWREANG